MSRSHSLKFALAAVVFLGCDAAPPADSAGSAAVQATPSTEASPDAAGVNKVLDPAGFADPRVRAAYAAAKQYAQVLEEIYCYCHCKKSIGHRALIECYESDHASNCDVCMNEAMIAARMTKDGKTPKEIQVAIDALYAG